MGGVRQKLLIYILVSFRKCVQPISAQYNGIDYKYSYDAANNEATLTYMRGQLDEGLVDEIELTEDELLTHHVCGIVFNIVEDAIVVKLNYDDN